MCGEKCTSEQRISEYRFKVIILHQIYCIGLCTIVTGQPGNVGAILTNIFTYLKESHLK